jgi:DNA polymerase-3 subunit epsilon
MIASRQIILDLETTGLEPELGHRIIEIGCIELVARRATGKHFHEYVNPEREIDSGAVNVHGIRLEDLKGKPRFAELIERFLEFVRGGELVIHNAAFDVGFLNHEMQLCNPALGKITDYCQVTDTLELARQMHPGQRNSLDALCKRYNVDNSDRKLHGALLDAEILADIYLAMTGGQAVLFEDHAETLDRTHAPGLSAARRAGRRGIVTAPTAAELAAHRACLESIQKVAEQGCLWLEWEAKPPGVDRTVQE